MVHDTTSRPGPPISYPERPHLLLINLLNDLDTLAPLLVERLAEGDLLNAFLVVAGMRQIGEDYLHRDPLLLGRIAGRLQRRIPTPWGPAAAVAARGVARVLWTSMASTPGDRAAARWLAGATRLSRRIATTLVDTSSWEVRCVRPDLEAQARQVAAAVPGLPNRLRRELLRLPSCFRSFDQAPEDLEALGGAFSARWPERARPLLAVGIRSSGGYLAPLMAAYLERSGYSAVQDLTLRPGRPWLPAEARLGRDAARAGAIVLLIDDPPRSWGSVAKGAQQLVELGFERERVVLMLGTFQDAGRRPAALADHPLVLLPFEDWAITERLQPEPVRSAVGRMLSGQGLVTDVHPEPAGSERGLRGHAQATYRVRLRSGETIATRLIRARGVGLGYFGEHALAVAAGLRELVPAIHGLDRGILYEDWLPSEVRLTHPLASTDLAAVATYVQARAEALPLSDDLLRRLRHRGTADQWLGGVLGGLFGRAAEVGRIVGARAARRLLVPDAPALIDNHTQLSAFARNGDRIVKSDFDAGVFTSDDFYCFDPLADVALAAVSVRDGETAEQLRRAYQEAAGREADAERWLLYQLAHVVSSQPRMPPLERLTDRRPDRVLQQYYGERLLDDRTDASGGPLCGIDLDGVLETMPLGFPATSPLGAMSLRALRRHGFRAVPASGRSLSEVSERCLAYGLVGGVAEYGGVVYDRARDESEVLVDGAAQAALDSLREVLQQTPDVFIDSDYLHVVRAFLVDRRGRRRGLSPIQAGAALAKSGSTNAVRVIQGFFQTDFAAVGTRKEIGLRRLAQRLDVPSQPPLAMAIGDTSEDIGMLGLARLGVAPANADSAVRRSGATVLRRPAQAGLAEAVTRLIGHPPGGCPTCAPPSLPTSSRTLMALLGVQDVSGWRLPITAARLWWTSSGWRNADRLGP